MTQPRLNPSILLAPRDDGYLAYDPARDRSHHLNPGAALLAELCDGTRSVAAIRAIAGPLLPRGHRRDVDRWIAEGLRAGLLVTGDAAAIPSAQEQSRRALRGALFCLRYLGQRPPIQALLRQARKAVTTDPHDTEGWYLIGKIAQALGRRAQARLAYGRYLERHPEDGEIRQIVLALGDRAPPPRAAEQTVRQIYRKFAASYDARMGQDLCYAGPQRLRAAIDAAAPGCGGFATLDLGCGSGLAGLAVRDRAARLVGVDLSPEMIALARARGIYDRLDVSEITAWLAAAPGTEKPFDLILCCDCLIYFGDLEPLLRAAGARAKPGGLLAISMERGRHYPFRLAGTGRYTHHPRHLAEAARRAGLEPVLTNEAFLRLEAGEEVTGLFAVLRA